MLEHEPHAQRKGAIQATAISRSSVTHMNMQRYSVGQKRKFYKVFFFFRKIKQTECTFALENPSTNI